MVSQDSTPVIAGYGEAGYDKENQRSGTEYVYTAIQAAVDDSGVAEDDVDGLAVHSHSMNETNVFELAYHLGFETRWLFENKMGNSSPIEAIGAAARAIRRTDAETVLVAAGDSYTNAGNQSVFSDSHFLSNYVDPFGHGGANSTAAFVQRRHMHEYGTTREQLSNIATTQREHAALNPRAIFRDPLTVEDYLNARTVVDPIHLYDCVYPCGGGGAVVVTSQTKAENAGATYVNILAGTEFTDPNSVTAFEPSTGLRHCGHVFDDAGVSRSDIDAVQLYDNYPIFVTIQLEDLGFCEKGAGGEFIDQTDLSITGELPLNTGGGQLSMGQPGGAGGLLHAIEAIRQVRGDAGKRQVENCTHSLATGFGRFTYGRWSVSAVVFGAESTEVAA